MTEPIHVCIITTAHAIDDTRVNHKFAKTFREAGFRVTWVGPEHALFDDTNENPDGIEFRLDPGLRGFRRLVGTRKLRGLAQAVSEVDVYYAPEPDSAALAVRLSRRNRAKVIFDIHEVYHGALLDRWLRGHRFRPVREFVRRTIARICTQCQLVLGVSDSVLAMYSARATEQLVVRSCAPAWFAKDPPSDVCGSQRSSFTIMHGKNHRNRGTFEVLDALEMANRKASGFRVVMFETGSEPMDPDEVAFKQRTRTLCASDTLDLRRGVPVQDMPRMLRGCDAGLIAYGRDLGVDSLPNRLFEYMAAGLPVIAPLYSREIVKIIESERCGLLVDAERPESIADAMIHLQQAPDDARAMGRRAREAFENRHNWTSEIEPVLSRIRQWRKEEEAGC